MVGAIGERPNALDRADGASRRRCDANDVRPFDRLLVGGMTMVGALATNLHEGSRSEYLAQYIFASFGTSVPVPHQEDTGVDLYCTLTEVRGSRSWPRAYFAVQVKSSMDPWRLDGGESVRWVVEHPLAL